MRYQKTCVASLLAITLLAADRSESDGRAVLPAAVHAVVDLEVAAQHTKAFKSGRDSMEKLGKEYDKELADLRAKIDSLKLDIELLKPSSERLTAQLQRETLIGKRRLAQQMFKAELERRSSINDGEINLELRQAIAELAAKRGILLVLRKRAHRSPEDLVAKRLVRNERDALRLVSAGNRARSVLYHSPELDLTQDLIKYLKAK